MRGLRVFCRLAGCAALIVAGILIPAAAQQDAQSGSGVPQNSQEGAADVTAQRILEAEKHPQDWITYSGDYFGKRFSPLKQITTANVAHLAPAWVYQTGVSGKFETTPLAIEGTLYFTGPDDHGYALDARTGRAIWRYERNLPARIPICCGRVNRGFAALGGKLFMATLDAHVIALDMKTGSVVWDIEAADYKKGYVFTLAPLVVNGKVIVGISGGEYGIRGFIDAYDANSGKRVWRFNTIPGPGERGSETWKGDSWNHGGAPAWVTGSYDPKLNLLYWGIGNPSPSDDTTVRGGDNLYSNSVVALDANTGALKWHFQFTPADSHDWDATEVPVLADMEIDGAPRKVLIHANRNGFMYVLDRTNGKFLSARAFVKQTWAKEIDANGRPVVLPGSAPTENGAVVCPGAFGATNWMSPTFSPQTNLMYVVSREQCDLFTAKSQPFHEGHAYLGSTYYKPVGQPAWGALRALDPLTGKLRWEFKFDSTSWAGAMSTAGGLVFSGDMEGSVMAFDAASGKNLWHFQTGASIISAPISFEVGGKQYVVVTSGESLYAFTLPE
jgi:alcohol dehydrogenase (cytochrome c)